MNYKRKTAEQIIKEKADVKVSAVLCLLFKEDDEWKFYLMLRHTYKGVHSAQVSFPGGRKEESDADNIKTALREAHEELGIKAHEVEVLGELSTMYIPPSNFLVYPFVAVALKPQTIIPDSIEVKKVITATLSDILKDGAVSESKVPVSGGGMSLQVKHYTIDGHVVWGATGMILAELAHIIKETGYNSK